MKIIFFVLIMVNFLFSISFTPLYVSINSKKDKNVIFTVSNFTKDPVPVNISVFELVANDGAKETRRETQKVEFYPAQFVLNPKEVKNIRLRYQGSKLPSKEEVFRVIAKELNINVSDDTSNTVNNGKLSAKIITKFTYEALLFVSEPSAQEKLKVTFQTLVNGLSVTISNVGNASVIPQFSLYDYIVTTTDNEKHKLTKEDLKNSHIKRVLAGKTNTFHFTNIKTVSINKIKDIHLERK